MIQTRVYFNPCINSSPPPIKLDGPVLEGRLKSWAVYNTAHWLLLIEFLMKSYTYWSVPVNFTPIRNLTSLYQGFYVMSTGQNKDLYQPNSRPQVKACEEMASDSEFLSH